MSSWGCESGAWYSGDCVTTPGATFSHPITLNIYNVGAGNSVGALVASATDTFDIPYRPSASPSCGDGRWSDGSSCFNGFATRITFDLAGVTVPNEVIIGVAYNTSHYGASPIGTAAVCYSESGGCGYDSLNVGLTAPTDVTVGTEPAPDDMYANSTWGGFYCDTGSGGTGTFRLDAGCWGPTVTPPSPGYTLAVEVAAALPTPASKDDCKKGGWQSLFRADGSPFKNQGDCIQYVNTGK